MSEREACIVDFLARSGWGAASRRRLPGDASFRRYERLTAAGGGRAMLMDAPPPKEDVRPFLAIARHLADLGFSAPRVRAEDVAAGLLLLEDLGDATYTRVLAEGGDEAGLYALAVDVLIALHGHERAVPPALAPYDDARLMAEAGLLLEWYAPAMGLDLSEDARAEYAALWQALFPVARLSPATLTLRDYHVDNLMWLPERRGIAACGLLDFQDAVTGPASYDLVSLLEDARRDVAPELAEAMLARYLAAFPGQDREAFAASFAVMGAQRNCKIVGIFTRLCVRDGKPGYLVHLPRVWRLLTRDLAHPALASLRAWMDRHIPPERRGVPPCR